MGFRMSWFAFEGRGKAEVLALAGLSDTGESTDAGVRGQTCAELPNGWTVLADGDEGPFKPKTMARLSAGGRVLAAWMSETVMCSRAEAWLEGKRLWSVVHDPNQSHDDLFVEGDLPPELAAIGARLAARQAAEGGEESDTDYVFDIASEISVALCGWRPDQDNEAWGEVEFTCAVPSDAPPRRSWLARLLGR